MSAWAEFLAAMFTFLGSHAIFLRPGVRTPISQVIGRNGFTFGFSLLSVGLLYWVIVAAANAPYVEVLPPAQALRWVPLLVMPVVCLLVTSGISLNNPLSFGGLGKVPFDPNTPGLLAVTRHPLLLALVIWAAAHMLGNGDLAHVILFGLFAGFSWIGMRILDRRRQREMGLAAWSELAQQTHSFSPAAIGQYKLRSWQISSAALLYCALIVVHPLVIGVSPLP